MLVELLALEARGAAVRVVLLAEHLTVVREPQILEAVEVAHPHQPLQHQMLATAVTAAPVL
jgi:hypothetical protein